MTASAKCRAGIPTSRICGAPAIACRGRPATWCSECNATSAFSDFTRTNGGTLFKLGSHATAAPPPEEWGISRHTYRKGHRAKFGLPYSGPESDLIEAPAGTIILYDARTWHRAGMNFTDSKRGAQIQAIIPGFIVPFMDTSATYKAFLASDAYHGITERERREVERLMVQKIVGPAGVFAFAIDEELTERARRRRDDRESLY